MPELLIELFSEEIPARMQTRAASDLKQLMTDRLTAAGLTFTKAESFVTPRRLTLVVDGLPERQPDATEERRGPRVGAPDQAIQGFLKAAGLKGLDEAQQRDTGKGVFWFAVTNKPGRPTAEVVAEALNDVIRQFPWPKSMRWPGADFAWVRPLWNVMALFAGTPIGVAGYRPSNQTWGHRFLKPGPFPVENFADYREKLARAYVLLDPMERRERIVDQAELLERDAGLALAPDPALHEEVAGLVEWPVVLIGHIQERFMTLPPEVLKTAMRAHQKYFALTDEAGKLAARFLVVANIEAKDGGAAIVAGNERVLRARLADAEFFWEQDRKVGLQDRVPALAGMVFHAKLGTLGDKVGRIEPLAARIAGLVPCADPAAASRAALLAKADLLTGMVGEFPELQGVMGRYYALAANEDPRVAEAIADHYAPQGPNDRCPTAPVSVTLALADKIDTLAGFFAIGETPTGSRDPFALRRAALGVLRLVIENRLRLALRDLFRTAVAAYDLPANPEKVADGLLEFLADRLKVHLRESGVRHDLIAAVFALGGEDDFVRLLARVEALARFLGSEDGANLLVAWRRAANILRIEEQKDGMRYAPHPDPKLFRLPEEKALHAGLAEAGAAITAALAAEDFEETMRRLANLRPLVDAFFDKVTVNAPEPDLRANRLRLLAAIPDTLRHVADFSRIEG